MSLHLKELFLEAAQSVYSGWHQDDDGIDESVGSGGICATIADTAVELMTQVGYEAQVVRDAAHEWVRVTLDSGDIEVDIPPHTYEDGRHFVWSKKQVELDIEDVHIWKNYDRN